MFIIIDVIADLLGINDEARQGALRFARPSQEEIFLTARNKKAIPPLVYLPKLLSATERFLAIG